MSVLPEALYTAAQVRALEHTAMQDHGIPGYALMERAGRAAFDYARYAWPDARRWLVLTGTGSNGGDGYILARLAQEHNLYVRVVQVGDTARLQGDARQAHDAYVAAQGAPEAFVDQPLLGADLIVDALFGTGLMRPVEGVWRSAIERINDHSAPVYSLDVPSGLNGDTGVVMSCAVKATATISFSGLKQGLFTGEAPDYCGRISFAELQIPKSVYEAIAPSAFRLELTRFARCLKPRARTSHKGHFGHVLVIGGEQGMAGAMRLAAEAAARVGAGWVSVATRAQHAATLNLGRVELMVWATETTQDLELLLARASVIAIGPGLGQGRWGQAMLKAALRSGKPLVVDADGLNLLAKQPVKQDHWVLTPHPGEVSRLIQTSTQTVQQDRFAAVQRVQAQYGGVVVLKGAGTLIQSAARTSVCPMANPGMASGGMGDLLTGIIAGLIAQGLDLGSAAECGVCLHAQAGLLAAREGERGMLAGDLLAHLRALVNP